MTLKKALCAVMAIVMLFALTACKSGGEVKELTVTLNGVTVSASSTLEMLGGDYSVKFDSITDIGEIFYKDQFLALVTFDENTAEYDTRKKKIKTLNGKSVSVNGITVGSSKSDVKNAIGSPTDAEKMDVLWAEGWRYCKDERYLLILFDKNDKVSLIEVDLELL